MIGLCGRPVSSRDLINARGVFCDLYRGDSSSCKKTASGLSSKLRIPPKAPPIGLAERKCSGSHY